MIDIDKLRKLYAKRMPFARYTDDPDPFEGECYDERYDVNHAWSDAIAEAAPELLDVAERLFEAHAIIKDRALELDVIPAAKVRTMCEPRQDPYFNDEMTSHFPVSVTFLREILPENADPESYKASAAGKLAALIEGLEAMADPGVAVRKLIAEAKS